MKNTRRSSDEAEAADLADLGLALELSKASHTAATHDRDQLQQARQAETLRAGSTSAPVAAAAPEVDLLGLMGGEESSLAGGGGVSGPDTDANGAQFQRGAPVIVVVYFFCCVGSNRGR